MLPGWSASPSVGVVVAGTLVGDTFAANDESVQAFHEVVVICAVLVAAGGLAGIVGITNPRRAMRAERCAGGQLYGVPEPAAELARPYSTPFAEPKPQQI